MFRDALSTVIQKTEGATCALIMGMDGIAVEKVVLPEGDDSNMDVAAAEVTSLVRGAMRAGGDIGLGGLRELVVAFENTRLIARLLTPEYFVVLAIRSDGNLGRQIFEHRKAQLTHAREIAL
jgi:predicted regulator of Ras-like GTPase activity (Roadblock/LC7/MglB family)